MAQIPLSVQLYTVRDDMDKDVALTLRRVADIGYKNVELAGFADKSAPEIKQLLDENGLTAPSAHVGIEALQGEGLGKVIEDYSLLGIKTLIVPYLGDDWRSGAQGYAHTAEVMNQIGSRLHTEGFELAYHNHDFELKDAGDGKTGWQILIDETDPDLVKFEIDTYWVLFAGVDPVEFINRYADRVRLLHIKDMDPADRSFAPVGTGSLPLDGIVAAARQAGTVKYLVVEQDLSTKQTPLESIEISYRNLKQKGYV